MQDDDGPGLGLEPGQRAVKEIAVGHPGGSSSDEDSWSGMSFDFDDASASLAHEVEARVCHEAVQPMVEFRWVTQPRQAAPRPDEGLLDGILARGRERVAAG